MQMLTRYGLFMIECAIESGTLQPDRLAVRARSLAEMEALRKAFPKLAFFDLREAETEDATVELKIPKAIWSRVVEDLVLELDYAGVVPGEARFLRVVPGRRRAQNIRGGVESTQGSLWAA